MADTDHDRTKNGHSAVVCVLSSSCRFSAVFPLAAATIGFFLPLALTGPLGDICLVFLYILIKLFLFFGYVGIVRMVAARHYAESA